MALSRWRRFRCTLQHQLLFLFLALCLWSLTRLQSPDLWPETSVDKCMDTPEAIHCLDSSDSSHGMNQQRHNNTTYSGNSNPTTATHNNTTSSSSSIAVSTTQGIRNHPNFTFDFPLCFVHVGKAAGSSVSCSLGLRYATCGGWMPRQPQLPWTKHFHMRKNTCGKDVATLLVTVRNPLTRIRSWFDFEKDILPERRNKRDQEMLRRNRGMIFQDCYSSFEDLVNEGLQLPLSSKSNDTHDVPYKIQNEDPVNMTCPERAWAAVLGVREFSYHEWYNYEHYWTALQNNYLGSNPKPSLLVLRTEHLSQDWSELSKEELFQQVNKGSSNSTSSLSGPLVTTNSSTFANDTDARFWSNLCHAMCPEIQIYQQILQHAANLNASQVQESILEIQALCPLYDPKQKSGCPNIPEFPPLQVSRRKYAGETKKRLFAIA